MKSSRALYGLVLAGGRSKRMGTDKSNIVHPDGRTLAKRAVDLLRENCGHVVVSLRREQEVPLGILDRDGVSIQRDPEGLTDGPALGIIAAMRAFPAVDFLVLACDLPRLDAATLRHLVDSRKDGEAFLAYRSEFDGEPEPLCAIYPAEALALFENYPAEGIYSPRRVLLSQNCRLIDPKIHRALENVNTPEDWKIATES